MNSPAVDTCSIYKNDQFIDWVIIPFSLLLIILAGHYGLFLGHTLFVDEDAVLNFYHHENNKFTNGWRPDVALGLTYFLSDPGLCFSWSLIRWWNELFDDGVVAFQTLSITLLWFACFIQFIFIRRVVPDVGRWTAQLISVLIAFSSLRYEFIFLRSNIVQIIATPLLSIILFDFLKQPKLRHYFYYATVIFSIVFLGSSISLFQMLVFIGIFFFAVVFYNNWQKSILEFWLALKRFLILNFSVGFTLFALGGWFFYGVAFENFEMGYARDPDYSTKNFFVSVSPIQVVLHFFGFLHAGLFSVGSGVLGIEQKLGIHSWNNFSPLFPFIFLVILFWKSQSFWEYAAKFIILFSFLFHEILFWFPGLFTMAQAVFKFYPPGKLHPSIQVYQILAFAIFLGRSQSSNFDENNWIRIITRGLSLAIIPLYTGLFVLVVATTISPTSTTNLILYIIGSTPSLNGSPLIPLLIKENIQLFNETMGWPSVLFYGSTAFLWSWLAIRIGKKSLNFAKQYLIAIIVLFNSIFLAWAIYPLHKETLVWDRQETQGSPLASKLEVTDRIARVGVLVCSGRPDYNQCIKKKFFDEEFGPRRHIVGYRNIPILEFSGTRSFTPIHVAEFIKTFMALENTNTPGILRTLQLEPPIYNSRVYDISAVNYLLSKNKIPEAKHLELVHKNKQFYLYRNHRAWSYYYFADRIESIESYEELYNAEKGVAYLWKGDSQTSIPPKSPNPRRKLKLTKFEYGDMEFKYTSDSREFLVIADSWHPNWRATINGQNSPILKTNGVFKGILLPSGEGTVHLFFDNSLYTPGIWISVIAWILFLSTWWWFAFKLPKKY